MIKTNTKTASQGVCVNCDNKVYSVKVPSGEMWLHNHNGRSVCRWIDGKALSATPIYKGEVNGN